MTLKDRGNIKWTALMLPEHVGMLRQWAADLDKVPRPELDEQEWQEFEITIRDAMSENNALTIKYWENGYYKTLVGRVHYVDMNGKQFRIVDEFDERYYVAFADIIAVNIL
ncbi:YolD-like family protein [Alkalihalobacterium sp. APHAB7]|uniref:YolD-like family protein n=1 Tax=Alkalihalobacterium sp. APHAB7 TaxID=3402081 RepID=UPI003AAC1B97